MKVERRTVKRSILRRQRHRAYHFGARSLGSLNNALSGLVEHTVVVGLEADTDLLFGHSLSLFQDLGDDAGADGQAAFTDGEASNPSPVPPA